MNEKKTELKDTKLNAIFLGIESALNESRIEEQAKCDIMLRITALVTECVKNPPLFEDAKDIHEYCYPYALSYTNLCDDPFMRLMAKLLL